MQFWKSRPKNIITKRLEFSGKTGKFTYWDKEAAEKKEEVVDEFVLLNTGYRVKGFDTANESSIYSNEIQHMWKESFVVKSSKLGVIASGKYSDIKETILVAWAKLHVSATIMLHGEVVNLVLKGTAYYQFEEAIKKITIEENKIKFKETKKEKNWAVTYLTPFWEAGSTINDKEFKLANDYVKEINEYIASKKQDTDEEKTSVDVDVEVEVWEESTDSFFEPKKEKTPAEEAFEDVFKKEEDK